MPVSLATMQDPFRGTGKDNKHNNGHGELLRVPQARVLRALMPYDLGDPVSEWPLLTRAGLAVRAGFSTISGTVTRVLNGIRAGSSSGEAHPGLIARGLIEEVLLDVEGVQESNYRATRTGVAAYNAFIVAGGKLPPVKNANACTNDRYRDSGEDSEG